MEHNFKKGMPYRLGLDLGTNSIGWAIASLNTDLDSISEQDKENFAHPHLHRIEKMGVRIFSDGREAKTENPLNQKRREIRGQRRRRDRFLARRDYVLTLSLFS